MTTTMKAVRTQDHFPSASHAATADKLGLSSCAMGLIGSEILKIAGEIRAMIASGKSICNLTVGDFSPKEFRIPEVLETATIEALRAGQTNYPPSDGMLELRRAVVDLYECDLGLSYPLETVVIASGARPIIYAAYRAVVDPGDEVLYPLPSWNNNHYCHLVGATKVEVETGPSTNFLPTASQLRPHIRTARMVALNSPLNPTGTVLGEQQLREIVELIAEENRRRTAAGERTLYLLWDQVYWNLTFGEAHHHTPPELVPESAAWTIFVDGISKSFAATGLRVGWTVAPPLVASRMKDILGHVGAWAPRAEQLGAAALLENTSAVREYHAQMIPAVRARLARLYDALMAMKAEGLPCDAISPQGAIYLSAKFDLIGRGFDGASFTTNDAIRHLLLEEAGFAVVPFQAFGRFRDDGWMRLSVGAVSLEQIDEAIPRLRAVLDRCK
ncbi:MAG: aminotransferase class I/II-fold pyridoxal phosphate-dependent enzyme [Thermoanaerobaculia bacterium]